MSQAGGPGRHQPAGNPDPPRLIVIQPQEIKDLVLSLTRPEMIVGQSDVADLVLDIRYVSRLHALITIATSGSVTIHDLNSTGGTFVNDERIAVPRASPWGHGPIR